MERVRVIVYGTGAMGNGAIRMMSDIDWIEIVGGINSAGEKVGKDLGEVASVGRKLGIIVSDDPEAVFAQAKADIVLHTVHTEDAGEAATQVMKAVSAGLNVITLGAHRLFYPWVHWPELGRRIDELAKKNDVTVASAGANPGFLMDLVPIFFTGACESVKKIRIESLGDIANVGDEVFKVLGFGMTVDEFREVAGRTVAGQMTWPPQIDLIADTLGWKLDEVKRASEPIIAKKRIKMPSGFEVTPGKVCGTKLLYEGIKGGETVITASWGMMIGLEEEGLEEIRTIHIEGKPNIEVSFKLGVTDVVTWARIVNTIPQVIEARSGLLTVKDLPVAVALK